MCVCAFSCIWRRSVLVKESPKAEDEPIDITPVGFAVRTVTQEYGGGAFKISGDTVVFSNYKDQRLYKQSIHSKGQSLAVACIYFYLICWIFEYKIVV